MKLRTIQFISICHSIRSFVSLGGLALILAGALFFPGEKKA
jgi:hypothetical protein